MQSNAVHEHVIRSPCSDANLDISYKDLVETLATGVAFRAVLFTIKPSIKSPALFFESARLSLSSYFIPV